MSEKQFDIIVVGAGPAGLTAAIYALRAGKSVLVIERAAFGGQMTFSPKIENYPGMVSVSGNELADKMVEQVINLGGEFELDEVVRVEDGDIKKVVTEFGSFNGKAVILANGVKHRMLGIDGEEDLVGDGISFCAVCDGAFYKGRDVAVIGGGNSALQEAVLLSEGCSKVTVVQNLAFLTGEKRLAEILESRNNVDIIYNTVVDSFIVDNGFKGIKIKNTDSGEISTLSCEGVFIAIGLMAENKAYDSIVDLDVQGYYASDESCMTKTAGIFVAGDCRAKRIRQVTTAAADGSVAALAACRYIDDQK